VKEDKEVENKVTRKRQQVGTNKKSIKFKKPNFKLPEFLKLTKKQILVLIAIILVVCVFFCMANYDKLGLVLNKHITDEDTIQVDLISSNNKLYAYQDEVLVVNSEGIISYNRYGKQTWELTMKGAVDDYIITSGKYVQIINKDKGVVHIYSNKHEVAIIKIDGVILSGNINAKGWSVVEYTENGNKTILAVYDNNGNLKYNVKLNNNIIGEYVLSNNSKYLTYIDVNVKGISATSSVMLVEFASDDKSLVETLHSSDSSLIYNVEFNGNNLVYRLDDEIIIKNLKNKEKIISTIENKSIVSVDTDKEKYSYVMFKDNKYLLGVESIGDEDNSIIEIREMPKQFIYDDGNIFVSYQKGMAVYNGFKMKIKEYNSDMVITQPIIYGNGRNVAFLVSNKLIMFSI